MHRLFSGFVKRMVKAIWSRNKEGLREWTKPGNHGLVGGGIVDATRNRSELLLENALLRQQLIVPERQVKRPHLNWRERGVMVWLTRRLRNWKQALFIVQPETVLRWHRDLLRLVWRRKSKSNQQGGRRPLSRRVVQLIGQMAHKNPLWRARGDMLKVNLGVAKSSVQKYTQDRRRAGPTGQSWGVFLRNHASEIWACDFLQTYDALFAAFSCL